MSLLHGMEALEKQCRVCAEKYGLECFDTYTVRNHQYYDDCRTCREERLIKDRERRRVYREENFEEVVFKEYQQSAKKRNIPFYLTQEQIASLIFLPCYYCGQQTDKEQYIRNGLDRINADSPYHIDHIVVCCWRCNKCKNDLSQDDFFDLCLKVVERHNLLERLGV